jgi:hypothetical protein
MTRAGSPQRCPAVSAAQPSGRAGRSCSVSELVSADAAARQRRGHRLSPEDDLHDSSAHRTYSRPAPGASARQAGRRGAQPCLHLSRRAVPHPGCRCARCPGRRRHPRPGPRRLRQGPWRPASRWSPGWPAGTPAPAVPAGWSWCRPTSWPARFRLSCGLLDAGGAPKGRSPGSYRAELSDEVLNQAGHHARCALFIISHRPRPFPGKRSSPCHHAIIPARPPGNACCVVRWCRRSRDLPDERVLDLIPVVGATRSARGARLNCRSSVSAAVRE